MIIVKIHSKKHNGMRPHDIAILLKIASKRREKWFMIDLAQELKISASEVSESVNSFVIGGLISSDKRTLKNGAIRFLEIGYSPCIPSTSRGYDKRHKHGYFSATIKE